MLNVTFSDLRSNAEDYFDTVEAGASVRVFRNGKPIAEIIPVQTWTWSWKKQTTPLTIKGLSLSEEILKDRRTA